LSPGNTTGLFSVSFNYLGAGTPSFQLFDTYTDTNFTPLDNGYTSVTPPPPTPNVIDNDIPIDTVGHRSLDAFDYP
jgi:hypothetical protein